jgi:hypothetical protein
LTVPIICSGFSAANAALKRLPALFIDIKALLENDS